MSQNGYRKLAHRKGRIWVSQRGLGYADLRRISVAFDSELELLEFVEAWRLSVSNNYEHVNMPHISDRWPQATYTGPPFDPMHIPGNLRDQAIKQGVSTTVLRQVKIKDTKTALVK